jgi:hypothetical protein
MNEEITHRIADQSEQFLEEARYCEMVGGSGSEVGNRQRLLGNQRVWW